MDTGLIGIAFDIVRALLRLLSVVLVVYVVISWLYAFDIVSRRNEFIAAIWRFCTAITDPLVRPLRRLIPPIAGVDLSVMVLLLVIWLLPDISWWLQGILTGQGPVL